MGEKNKLDDLFGQKFKDFSATPPEDGWDVVRDRLQKRNRSKRAAYWKWASTAAAILLAFYSGFYLIVH